MRPSGDRTAYLEARVAVRTGHRNLPKLRHRRVHVDVRDVEPVEAEAQQVRWAYVTDDAPLDERRHHRVRVAVAQGELAAPPGRLARRDDLEAQPGELVVHTGQKELAQRQALGAHPPHRDRKSVV